MSAQSTHAKNSEFPRVLNDAGSDNIHKNYIELQHKCSGHWGALTLSGRGCPSIYAALQLEFRLWPPCWMLHHGTNGPAIYEKQHDNQICQQNSAKGHVQFEVDWSGWI